MSILATGALAASVRICCVALLALTMQHIAGCNDADFRAVMKGHWGPNPALQPIEVDSVIRNQNQILQYIGVEAGLVKSDGTMVTGLTPAQLWYNKAQWGFNVGRQDCEIYLNTAYRLNREKQRNDSGLAALAAGSAAIPTPVRASAESLSIIAAAFGLTTALNDAPLQSYLFTEAPGLIATKVKDLQDTYEKSLTPSAIATSDQAYSAIQHYYSICLPESIEGVLLEAVANSSAKVRTGGQTGNPQAVTC